MRVGFSIDMQELTDLERVSVRDQAIPNYRGYLRVGFSIGMQELTALKRVSISEWARFESAPTGVLHRRIARDRPSRYVMHPVD